MRTMDGLRISGILKERLLRRSFRKTSERDYGLLSEECLGVKDFRVSFDGRLRARQT